MTIHIMIPFFRQINTNLVELLDRVGQGQSQCVGKMGSIKSG